MQLDDEGVVHPCQHIALSHDVSLLLGLSDVLLFEYLHRIGFGTAVLFDQHDFSVGALADDGQRREVREASVVAIHIKIIQSA